VDVKALVNGRPFVTVAACIVVIAGGLWWGVRRSRPDTSGAVGSGQIYFSADDGATWKGFSQFSIPPFEDGGKTWVRAHVVKCGGEAAKVAYLEQYPPAVRERLVSLQGNGGVLAEAMDRFSERGTLVKKPGDREWVVRDPSNAASAGITEAMCGGERAKEVLP
jgi:hypothetical protein